MITTVLRPHWPAAAAVRALSTLRAGGISAGTYRSFNLGDLVGDEPACVAENRRSLCAAHGLPAEPHWLRQVHGTVVADLDRFPEVPATADAAYTRRRGVVCAVLTADCLPVLIADVDGEAVAAAHAGWRGLAGGVLEATVTALSLDPSRLLAWLGPAIGPQRFEVGAEVRAQFLASDRRAESAFVPSPAGGRYLANLELLARQRLEASGVTRIFASGECTHSQPERFFSYRRDGQTGRHATLIWKD